MVTAALRWWVLGAAGAVTILLGGALPASASSTVAISGSFAQRFGDGGQGQLQPFGHVQESLDNDFTQLTLTFANGDMLVLDVASQQPTTPGASGNAPGGVRSAGNPVTFPTIDTVIRGTGEFSGASGTLEGELSFAGAAVTGTLNGTLTLP